MWSSAPGGVLFKSPKITAIETFAVNTGFKPPRPWLFCAIRTDEGLTGYSEFGSDGITRGLVGLVQDLGGKLIGTDPTAVEKHYVDMYRSTRQAPYGATQQAIAGIELALWDLAGKSLGVPVWRLWADRTASGSALLVALSNDASRTRALPLKPVADGRLATARATPSPRLHRVKTLISARRSPRRISQGRQPVRMTISPPATSRPGRRPDRRVPSRGTTVDTAWT